MIQEYNSLIKRIRQIKAKAIEEIKVKGYIEFDGPIEIDTYMPWGLEEMDWWGVYNGLLFRPSSDESMPIESLPTESLMLLYESILKYTNS